MEENGDKFEIKDNKKTYKITLKHIICAIFIIIILVSIVIYSIFKMYYENEKDLKLGAEDINQVIENFNTEQNIISQEKTEENFEEEVNYDYSDFVDENEEIYEDSYNEYDSYSDDYYDITETRKYATELALQFIYNLKTNPLEAITNEIPGYTLIKNFEKQPDGSYNINIDFEDISQIVYFYEFHPSCLRNVEDLKNNINILSQNQINLKDTGITRDYWAMSLSFEETDSDKYTGYFYVEEYGEKEDYTSTKFLEVSVEFNQSNLIKNIEYKEVPKETIPEEIIYYYDDGIEDTYSYSDYISQ